jgi:hypothetical protein
MSQRDGTLFLYIISSTHQSIMIIISTFKTNLSLITLKSGENFLCGGLKIKKKEGKRKKENDASVGLHVQ